NECRSRGSTLALAPVIAGGDEPVSLCARVPRVDRAPAAQVLASATPRTCSRSSRIGHERNGFEAARIKYSVGKVPQQDVLKAQVALTKLIALPRDCNLLIVHSQFIVSAQKVVERFSHLGGNFALLGFKFRF